MKHKFALTALIAGVFGFSSTAFSQSVLWNPGPNWAAGIHQNEDIGLANVCQIGELSDLSRAGNVFGGNPHFSSTKYYCDNSGAVPPTTNITNPAGYPPSYYNPVTGWTTLGPIVNNVQTGTTAGYAQYPGWAIWHMSGGNGTPMLSRVFNNALLVPDPCTLREVTYSYNYWPNSLDSHFISELDLETTPNLKATFNARLVGFNGPPKCSNGSPAYGQNNLPTAYVTMDTVIGRFDANGNLLRSDIIGVLIFNGTTPPNPAYNTQFFTNTPVFFTGIDPAVPANPTANPPTPFIPERRRILLNGYMLGISTIPTLSNNPALQSYVIPYSQILPYLGPVPTGTVKSVVSAWQIYSSVRGADLTFDVTNMELRRN